MSTEDRLAAIVRTLDWVASGLAENGVECGDLVVAAEELNALRLEMERKEFAEVAA